MLFVEENFNELKPTIGQAELEEKLETAFDKEEDIVAAEPEVSPEVFEETEEPEVQEETNDETETENEPESEEALLEEEAEAVDEEHDVQPVEEETKEDEEVSEETEVEEPEVETETEETETETEESEEEEKPEVADDSFKPSFELSFEPKEEKATPKQITFEDLLGHNYSDPVFEKVGESKPKEEPAKEESVREEEIEEKPEVVEEPEEIQVPETKTETAKPTSLNDLHGKSITFGLNDRIGFEKHLFGGSSEDMNRVVSQLSTFNSYNEAQEFIDDMVKPDYNNWEGKDEFAQRFMEIVEKKFK